MDKKIITSDIIGESYLKISHASGLSIYLYPKEGFASTYAMFSTNYGSIDTSFKISTDNEIHKVPAGIAHFLEHKLFESEDGDAFSRYAKTGASANAFTSFDTTSYLFSTTDNFYEALEILLDFVQSPYFTKETVDKEQGIIAQEIKMYDDDPNWRVLFNLLRAMYKNHTVKEDIAGTVESISQITPEYLYDCYKTFYNLNNMSLTVVGNFNTEKVLEMCDKMLKPSQNVTIERYFEEEPNEVVTNYIEESLPVASTLFNLGYKENIKGVKTAKDVAITEILLDILASTSSDLYKKLFDMRLVNDASFSYEYFEGDGFSAVIFGGESKNPKQVKEEINKYIAKLKLVGINEEDFQRTKKAIYGSNVSGLNKIPTIAHAISSLSFKNRELFEFIASFAQISLEDVQNRLNELFCEEYSVLSVISTGE
ncbi:MAG: pitrilysin family protein [Clostridia bacterium]